MVSDSYSDDERFDFVEEMAATIYCGESGHWVFVKERFVKYGDRRGVIGTSARGCIDAAMKEAGRSPATHGGSK